MKSNEVEAANRAEVTALLIRAAYRVYRPEADIDGEDVILGTPPGRLLRVQQKPRPSVDRVRYEKRHLWMLFPDPSGRVPGRAWYLVEHDTLLNYFLTHHGETASLSQRGLWSAPVISSELRQFLDPFVVRLAPESERGCLGYGSLPPDEMSLV